jgi:hypothetical protein
MSAKKLSWRGFGEYHIPEAVIAGIKWLLDACSKHLVSIPKVRDRCKALILSM